MDNLPTSLLWVEVPTNLKTIKDLLNATDNILRKLESQESKLAKARTHLLDLWTVIDSLMLEESEDEG